MNVTITATLTIKDVDAEVILSGKNESVDCLKVLLSDALRLYGYPVDIVDLSVKHVE